MHLNDDMSSENLDDRRSSFHRSHLSEASSSSSSEGDDEWRVSHKEHKRKLSFKWLWILKYYLIGHSDTKMNKYNLVFF